MCMLMFLLQETSFTTSDKWAIKELCVCQFLRYHFSFLSISGVKNDKTTPGSFQHKIDSFCSESQRQSTGSSREYKINDGTREKIKLCRKPAFPLCDAMTSAESVVNGRNNRTTDIIHDILNSFPNGIKSPQTQLKWCWKVLAINLLITNDSEFSLKAVENN